jgi:hypothetical protein
MKLFNRTKKPLFENVAQGMEADAAKREQGWNENVAIAALLLDDSQVSSHFFERVRTKTLSDMRLWISNIRKTDDGDSALLDLTQFSQVVEQAWTMILVEALNRRMTHQREITFRLLDAIAQKNETVILQLRDELREIESKTPTPEQMEKIQTFEWAFDGQAAKARKERQDAITRDATQGENHP